MGHLLAVVSGSFDLSEVEQFLGAFQRLVQALREVADRVVLRPRYERGTSNPVNDGGHLDARPVP